MGLTTAWDLVASRCTFVLEREVHVGGGKGGARCFVLSWGSRRCRRRRVSDSVEIEAGLDSLSRD
jgi:hypothetical protein